MKTYARIADGRVAEALVDYDGPISDHFGDQPGWIDVTAISPQPSEGWITADGGKTFAAPVTPPTPPVDLAAYAASARYVKETAGITVGTATIATDRESQALITGMWAAAQITPSISVAFKSANGFVAINAQQIEKIATAVAAHVQACFTAEQQVDAAITAGTITTTAQIDAAFAAVTG